MGLRHEYVLRCLGTFKREDHLYLVSPFMGNVTLFDWVRLGEHVGAERLRLVSVARMRYIRAKRRFER